MSVLSAIRLATMINELGGPAHELAVNKVNVFRSDALRLGELVQQIQVRRLVFAGGGVLAARGFRVGDDFAAVRVDELALVQVLLAAQTPPASGAAGPEDLDLDLPAELHVFVAAVGAAVALVVALVDGAPRV
ncbi:hypothetical protein N0V83_007271 [Neocucurbitaria cava]|uniref:Uncharacterized protein n=1 Tax=Neocucurbitaria cava TaxID=798079 RepID=A0A9W8Y5Q6_9PLEO|nr:hypothetical protein N0V83_007271 [Neocucurbitaria cava]